MKAKTLITALMLSVTVTAPSFAQVGAAPGVGTQPAPPEQQNTRKEKREERHEEKVARRQERKEHRKEKREARHEARVERKAERRQGDGQ